MAPSQPRGVVIDEGRDSNGVGACVVVGPALHSDVEAPRGLRSPVDARSRRVGVIVASLKLSSVRVIERRDGIRQRFELDVDLVELAQHGLEHEVVHVARVLDLTGPLPRRQSPVCGPLARVAMVVGHIAARARRQVRRHELWNTGDQTDTEGKQLGPLRLRVGSQRGPIGNGHQVTKTGPLLVGQLLQRHSCVGQNGTR